jgi:hypothetical protein
LILILRHFHDPVADALSDFLGHGARQIIIESWLANFKIRHSVGVNGAVAEFRDQLTGQLASADVSAVFNRVRSIQLVAPRISSLGDANYFASEATALFWSCLEAMKCPVINTVTAIGLLGSGLRGPQMLRLAASCGIVPADHVFSTRPPPLPYSRDLEIALFYRDCMGAQAPPHMRIDARETREVWWVAAGLSEDCDGLPREAIGRFAHAAGLGFSRLVFQRFQDAQWRLSLIDPFPLSAGGHVLIMLARALDQIAHAGAIEGRAA